MKVIIAGTRTLTNWQFFVDLLDTIDRSEWTEVVSGGAKGADEFGERYAEMHKIPLKVFPADWNKYGNAAGPIRNKQMAEYADALVAVWDGKSRGTKNMIDTARNLGLNVKVLNF